MLQQCAAVCVAVCDAVYCSVLQFWLVLMSPFRSVLQCAAVCCSVLQYCTMQTECQDARDVEAMAHEPSVLQYVTVCRSTLQCVAVCCSVLQCVAILYHADSVPGRTRRRSYGPRTQKSAAAIARPTSAPRYYLQKMPGTKNAGNKQT